MPPSKKSKKQPSGASSLGDEASSRLADARLIASLSRSSLESLLFSHLRGGTIQRSELEALTAPPATKVVVDRGIQREGTGYFDDIDDMLLVDIMSRLSLVSRLSAATCVCKSWRFLRDRCELWTSLKLRDASEAGAWFGCEVDGFYTKTDTLPIRGQYLEHLVNFVPKAAVTSLCLQTGEGRSIGVKDVERLLKGLPSLRSVCLQGKAVKSSVLQTLVKHACAPDISRLDLREPCFGSAKDVLTLLTRTCKLEHLRLPAKLVCSLFELQQSWTASRGGPPLLLSLVIDGITNDLWLPWLPSLSRWFPELELLSLAINGYGDAKSMWQTLQAVPAFPPGVAFQRLRELRLVDGCTYDDVLSTEQVGRLLGALLPATPALQALKLFMHEPYARSHWKQPGLAGTLRLLPSSMVHLELSDVELCSTELDEVLIDLTNLKRLALHNCGGSPDPADTSAWSPGFVGVATSLAQKARLAIPRLETLVTKWKCARCPRNWQGTIVEQVGSWPEHVEAPSARDDQNPTAATDA